MSRPAKNLPLRKAVNLTVSRELLVRAREQNFNLSAMLESALAEALAASERQRWLRENRAGIDAYNDDVEKHGVFSADLRSF